MSVSSSHHDIPQIKSGLNVPIDKVCWQEPWILRAVAYLITFAITLPFLFLIYHGLQIENSVWVRLWKSQLPVLLINTLILTTGVTIGALTLGFSIAWIIERTDFFAAKWIGPLLLIPIIIPCYLIGLNYVSLLGTGGLLENWLALIGLSIKIPSLYGLPGAIMVLTLSTYPAVYLLCRAALYGLDPSLEEAAKTMGRSRFTVFRKVTLPLLAPSLAAGAFLAASYAISDYGVVSAFRSKTFTTMIFAQLNGLYAQQTASALSLILVLLTIIILFAQKGFWGKGKHYYRNGHSKIRKTKLGLWQIPVSFFIFTVLLTAAIIPLTVLITWFFQGQLYPTEDGTRWNISISDLFRTTLNSFIVSGSAATIATFAALPVVYLSFNYPKPFHRLLNILCQSGLILPGVLIALCLILMLNQTIPALTYSIIALIAAYLVRFFPYAMQSSESSIAQLSPKIGEAGRTLGRSKYTVMFKVYFPLIAPGLTAGWIMVFLQSLRELPATLLLHPVGFETLTVKLWTPASEGYYAQAAPAALMLVILSLPILYFLLKQPKCNIE